MSLLKKLFGTKKKNTTNETTETNTSVHMVKRDLSSLPYSDNIVDYIEYCNCVFYVFDNNTRATVDMNDKTFLPFVIKAGGRTEGHHIHVTSYSSLEELEHLLKTLQNIRH